MMTLHFHASLMFDIMILNTAIKFKIAIKVNCSVHIFEFHYILMNVSYI